MLQFVKNNSANAAQKPEDTAKNGINNAKVLADTDVKLLLHIFIGEPYNS
ncbi:MAG: hypothetical protein AB8V23_03220 [Candidatus Midichloria sp.]